MKASKKKSSSYQNKITSDQFQFLLQNEVKVYPVSDTKSKLWYIHASVYGKIKRFPKLIREDEIQEAIDKTMLFYYDKLKNSN